MPKANKTRPAGIIVFSVLEIIFSAWAIISIIISSIFFVAVYSFFDISQPEIQIFTNSAYITYIILTGVYSLVIGILGLIAGIGILMSKSWARKLLLGLAVIVIIFGILNYIIQFYFSQDFFVLIAGLFGLAISIAYYSLILWYFNKKEIKSYFIDTSKHI